MRILKWVISFVFIISLFFILPTQKLAESTRLQVSVDFPVTNLIKYGSEVEVELKVLNNGEDFSGDLMYESNQFQGSGMIATPFDIASGEEKSIKLAMDASKFTEDIKKDLPYIITFFEKGIEEGKKVKAKFDIQTMPTIYYSEDVFLYNVTSNSDRFLLLKNELQKKANQLEVITLSKEEIPVTEGGFTAANNILIDDVAVADFSDDQLESLEKWIRQGGTLIVSGQEMSHYGGFESNLPLTLGKLKKVNVNKELTLQAREATLRDEATAYNVNDKNEVLVGEIKIGNGRILQTSFLIGDSPQNESKIYSEWFIQTFDFLKHPIYMEENEPIHYIEELNKMFEQFKITVGGIITSILIYTIMIGPILYFVLRKFDKREYAWGLIPVIALVTAVAIFFIGGKDRLVKPQIQQLALFRVNNDQSVTGVYSNSLLTNKAGDYLFTMDNETKGYPRNSEMFNAGTAQQNYVKSNEIVFKQSKFWSVNTIVGESHIPQLGAFEMDLQVENGMLIGTIEHNFPFTIYEVAVWTYNQYIILGDLEQNAQLTVNEKINQRMLKPAYSDRYSYEYDRYNIQDPKTEVIEAARHGAFQLVKNEESPTINGWTDEPLVGLNFSGNAKHRTINYFTQPFQLEVNLKGAFTVKDIEMTQSLLHQAEGYIENVQDENMEYYFEDEETIYTLGLPNYLLNKNIDLIELKVTKQDAAQEFEIWNEKKGEYVAMKADWNTKTVSDFLVNNQIKIRPAPGNRDMYIFLPKVELKGVAK